MHNYAYIYIYIYIYIFTHTGYVHSAHSRAIMTTRADIRDDGVWHTPYSSDVADNVDNVAYELGTTQNIMPAATYQVIASSVDGGQYNMAIVNLLSQDLELRLKRVVNTFGHAWLTPGPVS